MKKLVLCLIAVVYGVTLYAQSNLYSKDLSGYWKFKKGDNLKWAKPNLNTKDWNDLLVPHWDWEANYDGYGWFRKDFVIDRKEKEAYFFNLGQVDDNCEVYFNGKQVKLYLSKYPGKTNADTAELNQWKKYRSYYIPQDLILPNQKNTIAIRILDLGNLGGIRYGNIYLGNTVFYNQLSINLAGNWLKTDGSNEWLAGFYNNKVIYKNKIWFYGNISTRGDMTTIKLIGDKTEQLVVKQDEKTGYCMIGPDEAHLELCSAKQTYRDTPIGPIDTVGYKRADMSPGDAVYTGYIKDYIPLHNGNNIALIQLGGLNNKPIERSVEISPLGTFSVNIHLKGPDVALLRLPGINEANPVYLQPGKVTLQVIDPEEFKIPFSVDYDNRDRLAMFMGDNFTENKLLMYVNWLNSIAIANPDVWTKFQYTADRYARSGRANDVLMDLAARCIAENYQKYNDTVSLKAAKYWSGKTLVSSPDNHIFNSTFNIILQNMGEHLEGLRYLVKALDIAEKDKDQEYIDAYKQQVKQYVSDMIK